MSKKSVVKIKSMLFAVAVGILFTACSTVSNDTVEVENTAVSTTYDDNIQRLAEAEEVTYTPFSEYVFETSGVDSNYIITVNKSDNDNQILIYVEDSSYQKLSFIITAPDGYTPYFPYSDELASNVVEIISNDIDDTTVPDILRFTFIANSEESVSSISRFYTVDDSQFREINIVDIEEDGSYSTREYLDRTTLYHTEANKFICEITVDDKKLYDNEGMLRDIADRVKINTLTFDVESLVLISDYEELTEDNSLYFGYAYWASANAIAQYFYSAYLSYTDDIVYELENENYDDTIEERYSYYLRVVDERFSTLDDLKEYLAVLFDESVVDSLINDSPVKYVDISGALCVLIDSTSYDTTLGRLTFSSMKATESTIRFNSRQEKYDTNGNYTDYTDGGNFTITKNSDGIWIITEYRYPYE